VTSARRCRIASAAIAAQKKKFDISVKPSAFEIRCVTFGNTAIRPSTVRNPRNDMLPCSVIRSRNSRRMSTSAITRHTAPNTQ